MHIVELAHFVDALKMCLVLKYQSNRFIIGPILVGFGKCFKGFYSPPNSLSDLKNSSPN